MIAKKPVRGKKMYDSEYAEITALLSTLADETFRLFTCKLMPGVKGVLGVRLPHLRKIAGGIAKGDWLNFLQHAQDNTYEEIMLQGMVIGCAKADPDLLFPFILQHVRKLDNWSTCDTFF